MISSHLISGPLDKVGPRRTFLSLAVESNKRQTLERCVKSLQLRMRLMAEAERIRSPLTLCGGGFPKFVVHVCDEGEAQRETESE